MGVNTVTCVRMQDAGISWRRNDAGVKGVDLFVERDWAVSLFRNHLGDYEGVDVVYQPGLVQMGAGLLGFFFGKGLST